MQREWTKFLRFLIRSKTWTPREMPLYLVQNVPACGVDGIVTINSGWVVKDAIDFCR